MKTDVVLLHQLMSVEVTVLRVWIKNIYPEITAAKLRVAHKRIEHGPSHEAESHNYSVKVFCRSSLRVKIQSVCRRNLLDNKTGRQAVIVKSKYASVSRSILRLKSRTALPCA